MVAPACAQGSRDAKDAQGGALSCDPVPDRVRWGENSHERARLSTRTRSPQTAAARLGGAVRSEQSTFIMAAVLLVLGFFLIWPVVLILLTSFNTAPDIFVGPRTWGLENWRMALAEARIPGAIANTFMVWGLQFGIAMPVSVLIAWTLARTRVPFSHTIEFMFWVAYITPGGVIAWMLLLDPDIGYLNILARNLPFVDRSFFNIFSVSGIVWTGLMGNGIALKVMLLTPSFRNMDAALEEGIQLPEAGRYGVAMVFLPEDEPLRAACEEIFERCVAEESLEFLGWRDVPQKPESIGTLARVVKPVIRQAFIGSPDSGAGFDSNAFERKLYIARKCIESSVTARRAELHAQEYQEQADELDRFYVCSMSARTVVYKGLLIAEQLREFYPDLGDARITTAFALVHSRFSTNTLGEWKLAHPYRMLCHNGEINTVQGNKNWMRTRERLFTNELFGDDIRKVAPVTLQYESDTASFDQAFELLALGGREIEHVAAMMIPEPWYGHRTMSDEKVAFYEYHSSLMESWDGPAMMAFTDGHKVGAVLDRNGFRPMRYLVTKDDLLVMASETGVLKIPPEDVAYKRRLQPGMMFLLDFDQGRINDDEELKHDLATRKPYGEWISDNAVHLGDLPEADFVPGPDSDTLVRRQQVFGYSQEELRLLMSPLAEQGHEAYGSMGNDVPLAVLSDRPQNLFTYFKQQFA